MGNEPGMPAEEARRKGRPGARKRREERARRPGLVALVLLSIAAAASITTPACAKPADSTLTGTVEAQAKPVAHARVVIRNVATGATRTLTSDKDGSYRASKLPAGTYEVTASAAGFPPATATVSVSGGVTARRDLTLVPSQTAGQETAPPTGQSTSTMNAQSMGELPLNGRSASDVAALEPGVIKARTQASTDGPNGFGTQLVIYGARPRQNGFFLDDISVSDYANGPLGNAIGISLGVDALESMSVVTTNDEASYGRSSGGELISATRSGTNDFHGSVFYYFRNSGLDAANYFDKEKPPFHRSQFGAAIGGPIWRNHTFLFGDYEGIRQSQGQTNVSPVPSQAARQGHLSTGDVTVDPTMLSFINAFYPLPNAGLLGAGNTGVYVSGGQKVTPGNHFQIRLDHKLSAADSLDGVYMLDLGSVTKPDQMNEVLNEYNSRAQFFTLGYTHTFSPRVLNEMHFGIYRMAVNSGLAPSGPNPNAADTSFGVVPGKTAPRVFVSGLVGFNGGVDGMTTNDFRWTSIQLHDNVSVQHGNHGLQFGVDLERMLDNIRAVMNPNGRFDFNSLADFLTNQPSAFEVTIASGNQPVRDFRQTLFGIYAQDNWRLRPNISLDLGLRYEMTTVPAETHGYLTTLESLTAAQPTVGGPLIANPTLHNFEPRVGFAWDPFRSGRTIVSSGFGIFDVEPLLYLFQHAELYSAPFSKAVAISNLPQGSFKSGTGGVYDLASQSTTSAQITYFQPNPKRNYVMQWNFTVERELPLGVNLKLGYVGSRGLHNIFAVQDADIAMPQATPQGYLWPSPAGSGARINPNFGRIDAVFWNADSHYNAMVLQVRKQAGARAQIAGSFTWGKSIDDSSSSLGGGEYNNAISTPLWFAPETNRGLSDFNITRDLKILFSWQFPSPKVSPELATWALEGWQVVGVFEASTGVPFTPVIGGDPLGMNNTNINQDVPNLVSGPGCASLVNPGDPTHYINTNCFAMPNPTTLRGDLGRNAVIGPSYVNLDFSLFKNNYVRRISDTFNVQLRAEIFNILNHPNFKAPLGNKNLFDAQGNPVGSAGLINSTEGSSRQIQLAIKFNW